jgi:hypothetical protein
VQKTSIGKSLLPNHSVWQKIVPVHLNFLNKMNMYTIDLSYIYMNLIYLRKMGKRLSFIVLISSVFFLSAQSQNDTIDLHKFIKVNKTTLFEDDKLLEITLRFDITLFKRNKFKNEYEDAIMTYYLNEKDTVTRKIRLKSRGNFRLEYCDFPPVRLNLNKNDVETSDDSFAGIDKIKMVTQCKAGDSDYLLREFLVYKLYNVLTDFSFKVRLLKINYINTRKPEKPIIEYAFLIEPPEFFASRTNSFEIKPARFSQKYVKPEIMDRVAIFNYMIGNCDWSVPVLHNVVPFSEPKLIQPNLGLLVPYDFDYSGLVNAVYAVPPETLPIKSVRERLYLGICRSKEEFETDLNDFLLKKHDFYKVINEFPYLKKGSKKDMISFLNGFYLDFDKHNQIIYKLLNECQNF